MTTEERVLCWSKVDTSAMAMELMVAGFKPDDMPIGVGAARAEAAQMAVMAFVVAEAFAEVWEHWNRGELEGPYTDFNGDPRKPAPPR